MIHRPEQKHSNVDPLLRLPRAPPPHTSPTDQDDRTLVLNNEVSESQESAARATPACKIHAVQAIGEAFAVNTRKKKGNKQKLDAGGDMTESKKQPKKETSTQILKMD